MARPNAYSSQMAQMPAFGLGDPLFRQAAGRVPRHAGAQLAPRYATFSRLPNLHVQPAQILLPCTRGRLTLNASGAGISWFFITVGSTAGALNGTAVLGTGVVAVVGIGQGRAVQYPPGPRPGQPGYQMQLPGTVPFVDRVVMWAAPKDLVVVLQGSDGVLFVQAPTPGTQTQQMAGQYYGQGSGWRATREVIIDIDCTPMVYQAFARAR